MNPSVSFVVPTRNAARTLRACLLSLRAQIDATVEIIVVDNHSGDATAQIARDYADRVVVAGPERCAQRNLGARRARGDIVVFVDADMVLPNDIARDCVHLLGEASDPAVRAVVLPELAFGDGYFARCRLLEKELYLGDPAVEAARAFRVREFLAAGGYDESFVGGEDWELADRVCAQDGRLARASGVVWHDEGRVVLRDAFTKKRYYGQGLASYLRRDRDERRRTGQRIALRRPQWLAKQPALAAGLVLLKTVEFSGAAVGVVETRVARRTS